MMGTFLVGAFFFFATAALFVYKTPRARAD